MIDINTELFKRYAPKKKLEIINKLTDNELLSTTTDTILRIVKEVGSSIEHSRDKFLVFDRDNRPGNSWNSEVISIETVKNKIYLTFWVDYSNTDTNTCIAYSEFIKGNKFMGTITQDDRYGNPQTYYYSYDNRDRLKVIKSLLVEYINKKYKDKLDEEEI